jgi:hypothetical protein
MSGSGNADIAGWLFPKIARLRPQQAPADVMVTPVPATLPASQVAMLRCSTILARPMVAVDVSFAP